jgi:hypothetical protein
MIKSDRAKQALDTALTNGAFRSDYERLPTEVRTAIESLLLVGIDHPFFAVTRISSLLTLASETYRQSLHNTPRPRITHR